MRDGHWFARADVARLYEDFAAHAEGSSPTWGAVARWVPTQPELVERLDGLPGIKRQPNVFLATLKYLGAPLEPTPALAAFVEERWADVERAVLSHSTQTNEPGRCAVMAPLLAQVDGPIALLELGFSAGLTLFPDLYRYEWSGDVDVRAGEPDTPLIRCRVEGDGPTPALPHVAFRAGIDLNPLSASDPDTGAWLRALVWPGESEREERLAACLARTAGESFVALTGDMVERFDELLALVPDGLTPVVQHSAALAYLDRDSRATLVGKIQSSGAHWLSYEGERVLPGLREQLPDLGADDATTFVVGWDGKPVARAHQHGAWVRWY